MTLLHNTVGLVTIDLNNINFDDDNFNEDDPVNNVLLWLAVLHNRFKPCKVCEKKIYKELMRVAKVWDWYIIVRTMYNRLKDH